MGKAVSRRGRRPRLIPSLTPPSPPGQSCPTAECRVPSACLLSSSAWRPDTGLRETGENRTDADPCSRGSGENSPNQPPRGEVSGTITEKQGTGRTSQGNEVGWLECAAAALGGFWKATQRKRYLTWDPQEQPREGLEECSRKTEG